ncbi:class I SAM-dependent methyltransferase [Sphingomonas sp. DT-204]|uniref:class I SAM-dependent methyltransferase n=1 Tax=Sphingomonas sp. DT-204 TaxID=3396166 RepID=UPI003F1A6E18
MMATTAQPDVPAAAEKASAVACRLCGAPAQYRFSKLVLAEHDVSYFQCTECASLETEAPYWLDQAYGVGDGHANNLSNLDTGAAQRDLTVSSAAIATAWLLKLKNVIDVGGGDGLTCRFMRDHGLNAYVRDRYAEPTYAQGFTEPDFETPDLVTAFEVLEHLPNPAEDLLDIFGLGPAAVLIGTRVYQGEGPDWDYLSPESGQHVFFYSPRGFEHIAERFGYHVDIVNNYILFVKPERKLMRAVLLKLLLRRHILPFLRGFCAIPPAWGAIRDNEMLKLRYNAQLAEKE